MRGRHSFNVWLQTSLEGMDYLAMASITESPNQNEYAGLSHSKQPIKGISLNLLWWLTLNWNNLRMIITENIHTTEPVCRRQGNTY